MLLDKDRGGPALKKYIDACEAESSAARALYDFWENGAYKGKTEVELGEAVTDAHVLKILIYRELLQYRTDDLSTCFKGWR